MSSVFAPEVFWKTPNETRKYTMEFVADLPTGDTLSGTPTITEDGGVASDLTFSSNTVSGTKAQVTIAGGTDGTDYVIGFRSGTTGSETVEGYGKLKVRDNA